MKRRTFMRIAVIGSVLWRPIATSANQELAIDGISAFPAIKMNPTGSVIEASELFDTATVIKVIGVGGAGGNAIDQMIRTGIRNVEFLVADTNAQALRRSLTRQRIQLGRTGLGAGARPEAGRSAALESREPLIEALKGAHMVFIVAGMGGGTGTGASTVIAELAHGLGQLPLAAVTMPFQFEDHRTKAAESGIADLRKYVDSPIVLSNKSAVEVIGENGPVIDAFKETNELLCHAVGGITDLINFPSLVCLDFEDVRAVMALSGFAKTASACATGADRSRLAAMRAITSPFLKGPRISAAQGLLVSIRAARGQKMREINDVMNVVRAMADDDAQIVFSTVDDESLGQSMRVTVVSTGHDC